MEKPIPPNPDTMTDEEFDYESGKCWQYTETASGLEWF